GGTATGPAPVHTFKDEGVDTVTLTVDDGYGGTNAATATVTVLNVAPVFVPGTFTPPLAFTAPAPGDGFGESVAAVDGNAAVAARFGIGFGAVYVYDGNTDDTGGLN